jgi:glycosyltransferase involved in cell wall biosynthesis
MQNLNKRIIFYSSARGGRVQETYSAEEHYSVEPYSLGAIRYHLEKIGWTTYYANLTTSKSLLKTIRLIDTFKPDIIYTYGSTTALNPLICRPFCRHKAFKVIHGWDDVYGEIWSDVFGSLAGAFMTWLEKRIIKNSDGVVTLSYYNQQRGRAWGVESTYIPNGADIPVLDPTQQAIKLDGQFNLVYTGDMAHWKRTWEVCEAMRYVPKEIKLYLTGSQYPYLNEYFSDNCIYLGFLPKPAQLHVMAQADAFVVTANQDCNAKLQEYLRFKKPILGYDGRLNLFFKNERNAMLTKDYPSAIQRLASDPQLRKQLVEHAEQDIPVFSWAEIAQQFDTYFLGLNIR